MSRFYKIDLRELCNHRLVYQNDVPPEEREGLDGLYIAANDLHVRPTETMNGVDFDFRFGTFDHIMCTGQRLRLGITADKLHMIGFSYWGNTNDVFEAVYADGSARALKVPFVDWSYKSNNWWMEPAKYTDVKSVCCMLTSGKEVIPMYLHHIAVALDGRKTIETLVFPDNFLLHVFAVTLEDSGER